MRGHSLDRPFLAAGACALGGAIATVAGGIVDPAGFFPAWLAAFVFWLGLPLGAAALLMAQEMTGGAWMVIAQAPLRAAAGTMPLFVLAFLPVLAGLHTLYPWTRPEPAALLANRWYLNLGFFGIRAALYLVVWNFFAFLQWSGGRAAWINGIGLILFGYTVTFAAIDWIMSIEPDWFSTIYGMMVGAGQFVASLSVVLLVILARRRPPAMDEAWFRRHLAMPVTLLLAVDIFWAYTAYSQWLIIWEENLHAEIPWYLERLRGGWRGLLAAIVVLHLAVPLLTLVWTPAKKMPRLVAAVAVAVLAGELLQVWWLVLPRFGAALPWIAPAAALALGGLWALLFLWQLGRQERRAPGAAAALEGARP